jgi:hypothetical protein
MNAKLSAIIRGVSVAILALAFAGPARAQLMVSYDPAQEPSKLQILALRPNIAQPLFFHYANPGPGTRRNIKITLEHLNAQGVAREIGVVTIDSVAAKKSAPLKFPPVAAAKDAKEDAPWPALGGPPFMLRFRIEEAGKAETKLDVPIVLLEPRAYISVDEVRYDKAKGRLSIKLRWADPQGPPCPVELDLQASVIPGLILDKTGTFKQTLSKDNPVVELSADKVKFVGDVAPRNGRIYVTVDGYRRAFLYKCTFAEGQLTQLKDEMRARIVAQRYVLPGPKTPVLLEVDTKNYEEGDDDSPQKAMVELKFDRIGDGTYEAVPGSPFRGLREQAVEYKVDAETLVLRTKVADRVVVLNTEGINGRRSLQIRLLTAKGTPIPLADEQDERTEKIALYNAGPENSFAPLRFVRDKGLVIGQMVLDGTPPEELVIEKLPAKITPEGRLKPIVRVKERSLDQAPVGKVQFFLGPFEKGGKIPEKAVISEGEFDKTLKAYVAKDDLIVPAEARGKAEVSVQVTTATGVPGEKGHAVSVVGPKDVENVLTTITGVVRRGELPQPGVDVALVKVPREKDDPPPAKTKADDMGKFMFKDVKPGTYVIVSARAGTVGRLEVRVEKQQEKIEGVNLLLTTK